MADLFVDLQDGVKLLLLLEKVSGAQTPKPATVRQRVHKVRVSVCGAACMQPERDVNHRDFSTNNSNTAVSWKIVAGPSIFYGSTK